jgi:dienelactone hydrolase
MSRLSPLLLCLLFSACMTLPSPIERRGVADALARSQGWRSLTIPAGAFELVAYLPTAPAPAPRLTIYVEGDGLAWITGTQVSSDPTPRDPLALRLALAQPEGAAAYLGRPCQYGDAAASRCPSRYWTSHRFAPEVIAATDRAIDVLKQRFGASRLTLVGYSGGGAVAALVAARRTDVERLVTVAGNLDPQAWTTYQRVQPLVGSLNPADAVEALRALPQWHFVGAKDDNITPALVRGFAERFPAGQRPVVRVEPGFDHHCCWAEQWPRLWRDWQRSLAPLPVRN